MSEINIQRLDHAEFADLSAELMRHTGGVRFRATGRSMLPAIHDGDVLTLVSTDAKELTAGDVVLFRNGDKGRILTHRVISVANNTFTACGDALIHHDSPFTAKQVIGRVCSIERRGKDHPLPRLRGRLMAFVSRHSRSAWARNLKRLMRYLASARQRPSRSRSSS